MAQTFNEMDKKGPNFEKKTNKTLQIYPYSYKNKINAKEAIYSKKNPFAKLL